MKTDHPLKRTVLLTCLFVAPLLQLIGDALWLTRTYNYSWSIWRELSYIFFVPVGFLLSKMLERKSFCLGNGCLCTFCNWLLWRRRYDATFSLGGFYPIEGHNEFPVVVQSVLDKKAFAVTLFPPGLCFPVSLAVFGIGFLKYNIGNKLLAFALIICGVLFWLGNAVEIDALLIFGDALLLVTLCYTGYVVYNFNARRSASLQMQY